jgi:hypothetical protein
VANDKATADRNYSLQVETWKTRVKKYVDDEGNVKIGNDLIGRYPGLAPFKGQSIGLDKLMTYAGGADNREPMVPIPNEPALARYMGGKPGDMVKRSELLAARSGMKPPASVGTSSPEQLQSRASIILSGIANGTMDPNIELYGTNRDGLKGILAEGAVQMGLDLATLRQDWAANKKGLSTANSPQQLRMRQAADNIPMLLDQMAGAPDDHGVRRGGVIGALHSSGQPWWNVVVQAGKQATGHAGALKQYNILASKLAMEQAFLMSGGNQPPTELYHTLLNQYAATDNPTNIHDALDTAEETARGYQQSVANVGPITRSTPYVPGGGPQHPVAAPGFNLGTNPPAGTRAPDPWAKYRKGGK